jgi:hypothetical protein
MPAAGVRVRVFDRDIGGVDDDLTIAEGLSDASGSFRVTYDRSRAVDRITVTTTEPRSLTDWTLIQRSRSFGDPLDMYLPYLACIYTAQGGERRSMADLHGPSIDVRLPLMPPVAGQFVPSRHGFHFLNSFPGTPLPFSIPVLPGLAQIPSYYGLCGGMSAAAADYFYAGRATPPDREPPRKRTALYQYLFRRQIDSFSPFGEPVLRFVKWMGLAERMPFGTWHRSCDEVIQLQALFGAGTPVQPVGLVFANSGEPLWENHQVLATGYRERGPDLVEIPIYDPNYPENDQVFIRCHRTICEGAASTIPALRCERVAIVAGQDGRPTEQVRPMRGLFLMPYQPVAPL